VTQDSARAADNRSVVVSERLIARRNPDGGFGPVPGSRSEPEPTALAALATDDPEASAWLERAQAPDGRIGIWAGPVFRDLTAVSAIAMRAPEATSAAISWIRVARARSEPSTQALPHDPTLRGWSWTLDTFGWSEPTAWAVLALRTLGSPGPELEDGLALLSDRECLGGGWNYGNRVVLGEELPPFVQPTGLVLLALHGLATPQVHRGLERLAGLWRQERQGLLSLAVAVAALRRHAHPEAVAAARSLRRRVDEVDIGLIDTISLAWTSIALGAGLDRMGTT
jgi:hypothetical protein